MITRRDFFKQAFGIGFSLAATKALGASKSLDKLKILVIGAGLSGLAATYELSKLGHEVVLFEAQNKAGGRVLTLREGFAEGLYAEAGAMFVSDSHSHVLRYCRQFNIPLIPYPSVRTPAWIVYLNGRRIKMNASEQVGKFWNVSSEEGEITLPSLLEKYILGPILNRQLSIEDVVYQYDKMTFSEYLAAQGASEEAIALLRLGYFDSFGEGIDSISAAQHLRAAALLRETQQYYVIAGGSDTLAEAFVKRLSERIRFNHELLRVESEQDRITISLKTESRIVKASADCVILTIPFSVLKNIEFQPPLSAQKKKAIDNLSYTSVNRIFLECDKRFWINDDVVGEADTDLKVMRVLEHPLTKRSKRSILEAFTAGRTARELGAMNPSQMNSVVIEEMEKVHPGTKNHLLSIQSKNWDSDPFSKGAYCWFRPGELRSLFPILGNSEGRIFFAGEHTSQWSATMEGALESGSRAAEEIGQQLKPLDRAI